MGAKGECGKAFYKVLLSMGLTRLRSKPRSPGRGGMRVSSEALAKKDWSFGGLRRTAGATGSCPWGSTGSSFSTRDLEYLAGIKCLDEMGQWQNQHIFEMVGPRSAVDANHAINLNA